jgi:soluble lytic murein transglycosylase
MKGSNLSILAAIFLGTVTTAAARSPLDSHAQTHLTPPENEGRLQYAVQLASLDTDTDESVNKGPVNRDLPEAAAALEPVFKPAFTEQQLADYRALFQKAEVALDKRNDASYFLLSEKLKDYPLYPYLQYHWLKHNLKHSRQVKHFLTEYSDSRYATLLKSQWLSYLGKNKHWKTYLENYTASSNTRLQCYYQRARLARKSNERDAALQAAADLWKVGYSQPKECDPLFNQLQKSAYFTEDLIWQRFDAALDNNKSRLARYIMKQLPDNDRRIASTWLELHRHPERTLPAFLKQKKNEHSADMFTHAIKRLARKDIQQAIEQWDGHKQDYDVSPVAHDAMEKTLALKLAMKREDGAYERLEHVNAHDSSSRTWRVRAALGEQDWNKVLAALNDLSDEEKTEDRWQYWYARAYLKTANLEKAQALLTHLASQRSYYGYLAADRINSIYHLAEDPVDVSDQDMDVMENRPQILVARELMAVDKQNEAKLQWWHAVRNFDDNDLLTASKLAQRWGWREVAIFTIARAKHWDDVDIRFPIGFAEKVQENSIKNDLNPAIVYGLIRRESAFNENAHSPAGARGLMQLMPGTARQIAKDFKERWKGSKSLYQPVTNIRYGSYYYRKLLKQFDGNYALALAAYNAGPNRVKQWLPEDQSLPADIWIETIPYHETREYVVNVLAYALIYQLRANLGNLTMNTLAPDVVPYQQLSANDQNQAF